MEDEIHRILTKAGPKIKAILATMGFYNTSDMIQQYKSHALCLLEASVGAIYHAAQSHLDTLDRMQTRFVEALRLMEQQAFLEHNLAPLKLRRDIAILGLLHMVQLGEAHPDFDQLFQKHHGEEERANTRHAARRHDRQFHEVRGNSYYFNNSVFGATRIYNVLPGYVVNANGVSEFQSLLTKDDRFQCKLGSANWVRMYCCRARAF